MMMAELKLGPTTAVLATDVGPSFSSVVARYLTPVRISTVS